MAVLTVDEWKNRGQITPKDENTLLDRDKCRFVLIMINGLLPKVKIAGKRIRYRMEEILDEILPPGEKISEQQLNIWLQNNWDSTNKTKL